jgi:hypothetical protein
MDDTALKSPEFKAMLSKYWTVACGVDALMQSDLSV